MEISLVESNIENRLLSQGIGNKACINLERRIVEVISCAIGTCDKLVRNVRMY